VAKPPLWEGGGWCIETLRKHQALRVVKDPPPYQSGGLSRAHSKVLRTKGARHFSQILVLLTPKRA
jgi:hypothetical protein